MTNEELIQELFERLGHLHRSYLREFAYSRGLNLRQLESLFYLSKCNHYSDTPIALAEYLGLTKGTISQTIISLEQKKLLKKIGDHKDGRVTHLSLTNSAEKLVAQCNSSSPLGRALNSASGAAQSLQQNLIGLLTRIQRSHNSRTFGACYSCGHFRKNALGSSHQCGLTKEPLHERQSLRICREHIEPMQLTS